jgi:two-component system response regulator MprA
VKGPHGRAEGAGSHSGAGGARERRILLVEDDESIREFIEMALSDDGYEVAAAADGAAALELVGRWRPQLVLLDMRMPKMDGWKFSEAYRRLPEPRPPVVVLTAARDAAQSAAEIGADDYLAKPFDLADLMRLVKRFVPD